MLFRSCDDGRIWSEKTKRFLKPVKRRDGYQMVHLMRDGKQSGKTLHRLVAMAFLPNPMSLSDVDHRDGNKSNNAVSNLRWVTNQENIRFAWNNGLNERTREAVRERSSKPVRCLETGQEFRSAKDASRSLGECDGAVASSIRKSCRSGGFTWEYI